MNDLMTLTSATYSLLFHLHPTNSEYISQTLPEIKDFTVQLVLNQSMYLSPALINTLKSIDSSKYHFRNYFGIG